MLLRGALLKEAEDFKSRWDDLNNRERDYLTWTQDASEDQQKHRIRRLTEDLKSSFAEDRRHAAKGLRNLEPNLGPDLGPEALKVVLALVAAFKDDDAEVRQLAAGALGAIGPAAVPHLVAALQDDDAEVREPAAGALGGIGAAAKGGPRPHRRPEGRRR